MVPIIVGGLLGAFFGCLFWLWYLRQSRSIRNDARTAHPVPGPFRKVFDLFIMGTIWMAFGALTGFVIAILLPAPALPVEEKIVIETLVPFDGVRDRLVYAYQIRNGYRIQYQDSDGKMKKGICCNKDEPQLVEKEGEAFIGRYIKPQYFGWFAFRFSWTWYELHVPPGSVVPDLPKSEDVIR